MLRKHEISQFCVPRFFENDFCHVFIGVYPPPLPPRGLSITCQQPYLYKSHYCSLFGCGFPPHILVYLYQHVYHIGHMWWLHYVKLFYLKHMPPLKEIKIKSLIGGGVHFKWIGKLRYSLRVDDLERSSSGSGIIEWIS